jgi:hypothetical protein
MNKLIAHIASQHNVVIPNWYTTNTLKDLAQENCGLEIKSNDDVHDLAKYINNNVDTTHVDSIVIAYIECYEDLII